MQSSQRCLAEMCFEIASFPSVARLNEIPAQLQSPLIYVSSDCVNTRVTLTVLCTHEHVHDVSRVSQSSRFECILSTQYNYIYKFKPV